MTAIAVILWGLGFYAAVGLVTAVAFVTLAVERALPHPASVTLGARLLLVPGAAALWPLVLWRWPSRRKAPP